MLRHAASIGTATTWRATTRTGLPELFRGQGTLVQQQLRCRSVYSEAAAARSNATTALDTADRNPALLRDATLGSVNSRRPRSREKVNTGNTNGKKEVQRDQRVETNSVGVRNQNAAAKCMAARITGVTEALGVSDSHRQHRRYEIEEDSGRFTAEPSIPVSVKIKVLRQAEALLGMILPHGFPESVGSQYTTYATWQFCSMTASAAAGVMSTQALLFAMGLGAGSIPLAATLNWVIKDGLGQLGGIAFSSLVNTRFDANPKLWRVIAAISLDASMVLELLAPLYPAYFLPLASVANAGKNVSFLAASASRAAINNILSAKGNLADFTAKSGAQTIIACMVGTGGGVALSALLGSEWYAIAPACLSLAAVHLVSNYLSVRNLGIPTFDSQRLSIVVDFYQERHTVSSPADVAGRESILMHSVRQQMGRDRSPPVKVGSRLEEAVRDRGELEELCRICQGRPFLLSVRGDLDAGTAEVHVLFLEGCGSKEVLAGSYVAQLAKRLLLEQGLRRPRLPGERLLMHGGGSGPSGQILSGVVAEALKLGDTTGVSPALHEALLDGDALGRRRERGGGVAGEFVHRVGSAGWDTSVIFLEEPCSVRLRLDHAHR